MYYNLLLCSIPLEMYVRLMCAIKLYLLTYDGIVERNRVSSLQSHEKAHYYYYYYLKPR